jgi:hypothetical protein
MNKQLAFYVSLLENEPRIVTSFVQPPIPNGDHWIAYSDDLGADASPYGQGQTEQEAIEDLTAQLEDAE